MAYGNHMTNASLPIFPGGGVALPAGWSADGPNPQRVDDQRWVGRHSVAPALAEGCELGPLALREKAADGKIIQRISRPELSDRVNTSRMADADSELVVRSQHADPAAFEELIRQHQRMVQPPARPSAAVTPWAESLRRFGKARGTKLSGPPESAPSTCRAPPNPAWPGPW